ncbi:MAG: type I glyceraldehyde-3-phosphate dehydrogenase [Candidatus Paceibacterota bacterium]
MAIRVAINGFGRIGRAVFKVAHTRPEIEVVGINDLGDAHNLAYLLKYDTAYRTSDFSVSVKEDGSALIVDGKEIRFISERDGSKLPWKELNVDIVVESTGLFTSYEKAKFHLEAGARRVVISAPAKDSGEGPKASTVLMGINEHELETCDISSNASCTTNAGSPLIQILHEAVGIEKAMLNTTHGYTASQSLVDAPNKKDFREGRAAAMNMVPASTGAAIAVTKVVTDLENKFDGIAVRVPVVTGSLVDVTFLAKRNTTVEEINDALSKAAGEDRWKRTFAVTDEPLVSSDIIGRAQASIVDLALTRVVDGNLVKVMAWYDNEMGYTHSLVEHVIRSGRYLQGW